MAYTNHKNLVLIINNTDLELFMVVKKYIPIILLILFNICYANDKVIRDEKDTIIAKIGQVYNVTFKDLSQYVVDWQYDIKYRNKNKAYRIALDALIKNQMKRFDFFERGFNNNNNLMRNLNRIINEELTVDYFNKIFNSKYLSEKNALDAYKLMDKEVVYYQIVLPLHGDEKKGTHDSLKTKAIEIQNNFSKAKDVEKFVKIFSFKNEKVDNPKKVAWEQSISDPVGRVIFNLKVGFTRVIESIDGYYIVKVTDIKKLNLEPFEKIKKDILAKLKDLYFPIYDEEFLKYKKELVDESTLKWNERSLAKIAEWSNIPKFYFEAYEDTIQNILKKGENFEILSYNKGQVDLKEYLRLLDEVLIMEPEEKIDNTIVKKFILEAVRTDNIIKKAKELDLEKDVFNPYTKNAILKHRIALQYNKEVIENQIPGTTEKALHKFYEEQRDSIFYQLKVVEICARIYTDSIKAAEEIKEINKGTPFEKISNSWFNKGFVRERDGKLKSYFSTEPSYLAEASFRLELNEVAGPIGYYDTTKVKKFAVIKCANIIPEKQLIYDDVKKTIAKTFKDYYRQKISDEVDLYLKNKYKVEIFENVLSHALSAE